MMLADKSWDTLGELTGLGFDACVDGDADDWAEKAWAILVEADVWPSARDSVAGWHERAYSFLALVGLYHDFCEIACQEPSHPPYKRLAERLAMSHQMVGDDAATIGYDRAAAGDADAQTEEHLEMLRYLALCWRAMILPALMEGFEGPSELIVSLCAAAGREEPGGSPADPFKDARLYSWFDQGCPVINNPA